MKHIGDRLNKKSAKAISLTLSLTTLALGSIAAQAAASDRRVATERFTEYARVIDAQPIYREVRTREPRQECWIEEQQRVVGYEDTTRYEQGIARQPQSNHSSGDVIIGGVIGGVIGNQLGRGHSRNSRTGATVAGAIIGGAIANESSNRDSRHRRQERTPRRVESRRPVYETTQIEKCKRVSESISQRKLQHYNVTYEYKGRRFITQMPRDPGNRIELQVSVAPARR